MKKEMKRRRDSKMTAQVTENRQYRYFDRYLTDNLAHRLVLVNVETKELRDLTPRYDRRFMNDGELELRPGPGRQDTRGQDQFHAAAVPRVPQQRRLSRADRRLRHAEEPDGGQRRQRRLAAVRARRPLARIHAHRDPLSQRRIREALAARPRHRQEHAAHREPRLLDRRRAVRGRRQEPLAARPRTRAWCRSSS